ncbi:alkaline phosphatase [Kordiimonas sp. SCSIO 12610]|uniref:alkaline phosphatase n=1 Tax=Kordiimonas sp. SCSIO 12610 TaxID=2829597 RepID=UPI00210EA161|nr:alkaline phosphatase [Kordiimonas sp. SCSIO 12610]UTW54198.1 alkaline phosphatase [Kordiimonas sp. SCSIO 12610]
MRLTRFQTLATTLLFTTSALCAPTVLADEDWLNDGKKAIAERLATQPNTKRAKNVILFVGDGMGISTLTAGRIREGQLRGESGEENYLSFEKFPYTALVKTYNIDAQVPDSAGTASALNTGSKTRIGVINTGPDQPQGVCEGSQSTNLKPLAYYAEQAGLSTGIVSTARLTHATPAAVYAHSPSRNWENDTAIPEDQRGQGCEDIAKQILGSLDGDGLEVALGGGKGNFLPDTEGGWRKDGLNIPAEWVSSRDNSHYVTDTKSLKAIDLDKTDRLLGLFGNSHMDFDAQNNEDQPSLSDLTETAIKLLSKNDGGYYLMVEGGRIDHAHHGGNAYNALGETVALSAAVKRAMELVDLEETLILVTADHSHVFTIAGYPERGNPILGLVKPPHSEDGDYTKAEDGKPYTTLGYHNGHGAISGERADLTHENVQDPRYLQQAAIPLGSETHGGEDVALFGIGPWAHLVRGTMEQNVVFHIMDHALNLRERAGNKE